MDEAVTAHLEHGLEVDPIAEVSESAGNPAAPSDPLESGNGSEEVVAAPRRVDEVDERLLSPAFGGALGGATYEEPLGSRRRPRIDNDHGERRRRGGQASTVECAREPPAHGDDDDGLGAIRCRPIERLVPLGDAGRSAGAGCRRLEERIRFLWLEVDSVPVLDAVGDDVNGNDLDTETNPGLLGEACDAVGYDANHRLPPLWYLSGALASPPMNPTELADSALDGRTLRRAMELFEDRLADRREELNRLNVYPVPDGDTGDNLLYTVRAVLAELARRDDSLPEVCAGIARGSLLGARGSSGVILSQALRGFTNGFGHPVGPDDIAAAFLRASDLAYAAVSDPTEGTILTVAREAAEAVTAAGTVAGTVLQAAAEGRRSLARTPDLLPVLRRAGVVDAGGLGYLLFLEALAEAVTGIAVEPFEVMAAAVVTGPLHEEVRYRYEVICHIESDATRIAGLRGAWRSIGDTVAMVGGDGTWKAHVHTSSLDAALDAARAAGDISDVEITDLLDQVDREESLRGSETPASHRSQVVAVAEGDGLVALFLEAGASRVIIGGASRKPSTGELLTAVEACAGEVVLLPGDKDVLPAAQQVVENSSVPVVVVPARGMIAGLVALDAFAPDDDAATNADRMTDVAAGIRWADVKRVVRATDTPLGRVEPGQWLALGTGGGIAVADTPEDALVAAADALVTPETNRGVVVIDDDATGGTAVMVTLAARQSHVIWESFHGGRPTSAYGIAVHRSRDPRTPRDPEAKGERP